MIRFFIGEFSPTRLFRISITLFETGVNYILVISFGTFGISLDALYFFFRPEFFSSLQITFFLFSKLGLKTIYLETFWKPMN